VIYWFGHIQGLNCVKNEGIFVMDGFPTKFIQIAPFPDVLSIPAEAPDPAPQTQRSIDPSMAEDDE
jgi:hypothetical protein